MESVHRLTQAYSQVPWRRQVQLIGLFLLVLILAALVAGIYLSVTARAATIGRSIQHMRDDIELKEREIADLEAQLAFLTSDAVMQERAESLDFRLVEPEEILYVIVPGYIEPEQANLATNSPAALPSALTISPEYTQSLFDWLRERVFEPAAPLLDEVEP